MKTPIYISEIIAELEPEESGENAILLKEFAENYDTEIRYKILEMWNAFLRDRTK